MLSEAHGGPLEVTRLRWAIALPSPFSVAAAVTFRPFPRI